MCKMDMDLHPCHLVVILVLLEEFCRCINFPLVSLRWQLSMCLVDVQCFIFSKVLGQQMRSVMLSMSYGA